MIFDSFFIGNLDLFSKLNLVYKKLNLRVKRGVNAHIISIMVIMMSHFHILNTSKSILILVRNLFKQNKVHPKYSYTLIQLLINLSLYMIIYIIKTDFAHEI